MKRKNPNVVESHQEARSHQALTYVHSGAAGTWTPSEMPPAKALAEKWRHVEEEVWRENIAPLEHGE